MSYWAVLVMMLFTIPYTTFAEENCAEILKSDQFMFSKFWHGKNPQFHVSDQVEKERIRQYSIRGKASKDPVEKIYSYLNLLQKTHERSRSFSAAKERLREFYHDQYLIQPNDVPEAYFDHQKRIARDRGNGDIRLTKNDRSKMIQVLIKEQKNSLNAWFDYFLSPDSDSLPFYSKYWAFQSVVKLSKFDPEAGRFAKRSSGTVSPFPELNREALALVMDPFIKKMNGIALDPNIDAEFLQYIESGDFSKMYGYQLKEIRNSAIIAKSTEKHVDGIWIHYPKKSDHRILVDSLKGKNTGWCTAGEETAKIQLSKGDFHVFYSFDKELKPTHPRVAIRMEENSIVEVRGVAKDQNLDASIANSNIVSSKLEEFGHEGEKYLKKDSDMRQLSRIEQKIKDGENLDIAEIRFIYEIDSKISGFGYEQDPRIDEILSIRNPREDYAKIFNVRSDQIGFDIDNLTNHNTKIFIGDLNFKDTESAKLIEKIEYFRGNLSLSSARFPDGLKLPKRFSGILTLFLKSAEGVTFPEFFDGTMKLISLESAKNLILPKKINGFLGFYDLESSKDLKLPSDFIGTVFLPNISSDEPVRTPENFTGRIIYMSGPLDP